MKAICGEIAKENKSCTGTVCIDPSKSGKTFSEVDEMVRTLLKDSFNFLKKFRIDIRKDCLEIHPAVHYTLGGLHINERGETSVQRLFAAGENSSNVHGANRISGNALAETQVFGTIAGKNASDLAKKNQYPAFPKAAAKKAVCELNYFMEKKKDSVQH